MRLIIASILSCCVLLTTAEASDNTNSFLRTAQRRIEEDNASATIITTTALDATSSSSSTNGGNEAATTQCEPCPVCDVQQQPAGGNTTTSTENKIKLRFLTTERSYARLQVMLEQMAEDYTRMLGASAPEITVVGLPTLAEVEREVKFDVKSQASQFDGYIITPLWIGDLADGLFETSDFMKEYSTETDPTYWTDILLFYREVISSYDNKLFLFPFDGDLISMFYRRDLLDRYQKDVPKTWDEYNELAAFFHGKTDTIVNETDGTEYNVTLSGSCIGRKPATCNAYWAQTVLAPLTQVRGTYEGSMLDSSDLSPLLGLAMEEMLRLMGEQAKYGVPGEFGGCVDVHVNNMNEGKCVLTYNWGNSFSDHVREGSTVRGKLGVAPTPGSPVVLNRQTGKLEECTEETCPYAILDERSGRLINQAPYGAYGGFSGAVSGGVSEEHQIAAAKFFAFATSAKKAIKYVIPDANNLDDPNAIPTGMDPYAKSMLKVKEWTDRGFDEMSAEQYLKAIESQLGSENVVIDLRMPLAAKFMSSLDTATTAYTNDTHYRVFDNEEDAASARAKLASELARQWRKITVDYDTAEDRQDGALLELYQRDRGVYVAPGQEISLDQQDNRISSGAITAIVASIFAVMLIMIFVITYSVKQFESKKREDMWFVSPSDIFDTKEVLGRGSFGVVTKGFLRGTPVALKHAKGWEPDISTSIVALAVAQPRCLPTRAMPPVFPMATAFRVKRKSDVDLALEEAEIAATINNNNLSQASTGRNADRRRSVRSSLSDEDTSADDFEDTIGGTLLTTEPSSTSRSKFFRRNASSEKKNSNANESLRAELLLLVKLRHDNIVQTLGASQDVKRKQLVLILQFMENGSIRGVLKDPNGVAGSAGMSLEIQWALQVARGVNFLHTIPPPAGPMVHADLKSSNVLLDSSYNANISDFGLATKTMGGLWGAIQRSTKSNNPKGSILWMAPEVLNGADPTPASDVYSYSMFLVELMTRDRPYGVRALDSRRRPSEMSSSERSGLDDDKMIGLETSTPNTADLNSSPSGEDPVDAIVLSEVKSLKPKSTSKSSRRQNDNRVSWSINMVDEVENSGSTAPDTELLADDNRSKTSSKSSLTLRASQSFYAIVDGKTLTRDDIVGRVKDLALDPPFRPILPNNAPQILVDICTECWQKNPKRRPTMKEVEERLVSAVPSSNLTQRLMQRGSIFESILPLDVQEQLAKGETVKPKTYEHVTVLFSDIVSFTSMSSALTAEEVGDLIFRLFTKFDNLCKKNGVKKLDVIGDAFLGVVGVPDGVHDHASRAARFALDAIVAANETLVCPAKPQLGYVKVRFGLASGSAVAVVIGTLGHPKYTLFGDVVNTASRMESSGEADKCQVTKETANLIRDYEEGDELDRPGDDISGGIKCVFRGKMKVKGKGEMETFFLEDKRV